MLGQSPFNTQKLGSTTINISVVNSVHNFPLCIETKSTGENKLNTLLEWYSDNKDFLENQLLEHGAVLFRGFSINTPSALQEFVNAAFGDTANYVDGNSPRSLVKTGVYTSTEYPSEQTITLHNELSYSHSWPAKLFFCCCVPPSKNGETPLVDGRRLINKLDKQIVSLFIEKQIMYIRNLHAGHGLGPSWQNTFESSNREQVEQYLKADINCKFEWNMDGGLRIVQIRSAVARHPQTNEIVWFNQADQFHLSSLGQEYYTALKTLFKGREDELPSNAYFGDGTPIEEEMINEIRQVCLQEAVYFPWCEGDLLIIDNMLIMHGRMPFEGLRKILVSMIGKILLGNSSGFIA